MCFHISYWQKAHAFGWIDVVVASVVSLIHFEMTLFKISMNHKSGIFWYPSSCYMLNDY